MDYGDERLPLLTLEEAHDVIDALVHSASCGDDEAGRLARYLAARVPSRHDPATQQEDPPPPEGGGGNNVRGVCT